MWNIGEELRPLNQSHTPYYYQRQAGEARLSRKVAKGSR